ncbi:MAG: hypothetical protein V1911_01790 [Candidatus Micrarchaeota archaeon]
MKHKIAFVGFMIISIAMAFYVLTAVFRSGPNTLLYVLLTLLLVGIIFERKNFRKEKYDAKREIAVIIATVMGAIFTYLISLYANLGFGPVGPVIAAGFVGLAYCLIPKNKFMKLLEAPVYCGAFVGMSSSAFIGSWIFTAAAGAIAGLLLVVSHEDYKETGGYLGTTAFASVNFTKRAVMSLFGW